MIIINFFLDSLIVYVHNATTIRTAQRNDIKHFNLHLQSPGKIYRSVSCRQELHEIFCKVQESKSPIKLTGVKRKLNFLDYTKEDIEINNTTKSQVIGNASFPYLTSLDSILTIKEILDTKKNGEKVSLIGYLAAENCPVIQTWLKKSGSLSTKKKLLLLITLA